MTKGQRAMAVAMIYPEPEKGKRNDLLKNSTSLGFNKAYLSRARTILRYAPTLADGVLSGADRRFCVPICVPTQPHRA